MSLPVRPIPAPPQRGDWERHKQRIAQLYLEENKPLREVADVMRIEHDFTATYVVLSATAGCLGLELAAARGSRPCVARMCLCAR